MKSTSKFEHPKTIQKIGAGLILLAGLTVLLNVASLLPKAWVEIPKIKNFLFLIGALFYLMPRLSGYFKKGKSNPLIVLVLFTLMGKALAAQDHAKQVKAFEESFAKKSTAPMEPYIGPELKFDPVPASRTLAILQNIVTKLPKLNAMTLLESHGSKAKVAYDFVGLGHRESYIHFNEKGQFSRIELIENLIQEEMRAQQELSKSVQLPNPGALGDRFRPTPIEFSATDGLTVEGNLYDIGKDRPIILLCHQAGYNRMEYADIAPKLNELGFNCLAIDQRSGGKFAGRANSTAERAKENGFKNEMIDAMMDIRAAISFLGKRYGQQVIVWGSSYSSSLAILEGISNPDVKAMVAFSPGDYFGAAAPSLGKALAQTDKPFFVTSSQAESTAVKALLGEGPLKENQLQFIPTSKGFHGSRALWTGQEGAPEYWQAIIAFLENL